MQFACECPQTVRHCDAVAPGPFPRVEALPVLQFHADGSDLVLQRRRLGGQLLFPTDLLE
jgi:hypothetical protein